MERQRDSAYINNELICNFWEISNTMRHISEGKGSQKRILILLLESGAVTQRELTRRLGIQPGSASEVIGKLEAAGLLVRTPSETDHRTAEVHLTEAGLSAAQEAAAQRGARHKKMFSCLSGEEKEALLGLLEKVNASWRRQYFADTGADCRKGRGALSRTQQRE